LASLEAHRPSRHVDHRQFALLEFTGEELLPIVSVPTRSREDESDNDIIISSPAPLALSPVQFVKSSTLVQVQCRFEIEGDRKRDPQP
jgi:hypothetical protein